MRRPAALIVPLSFAFAAQSAALPPGETRFREGANHHVGDDSFVARFGRAPGAGDEEALRMRTHLEHVRARLAAAPATRPALAARRAELLGYLGDYIAKGTTPQNTRMPWRSPVFIDDFGNVCAVGYLIERSAGRALPERIARLHRFDFLEDIAAAMPEVSGWIAASGFTLEELASIQPGYEAPMAEQWSRWDLAGKVRPKDGAYGSELATSGIRTKGTFAHGQMQGAWTRTDRKGRVLGKGELVRGAGTWRSFYPGGKRLAEGPYAASLPHGAWTFYHPSGHVAAEGSFVRGERDGAWRFYYDTAGKAPIAAGAFSRGSIGGRWDHFDPAGRRVAVSSDATPAQWRYTPGGHLLEVAPYADGVRHVMHRGNILASDWRLDGFFLGDEHLYVQSGNGPESMFDANGRLLAKEAGRWFEADCRWSAKRKAIARNGDITTLHGLLYQDAPAESAKGPACTGKQAVATERGARLDKILATRRAVRTPSPAFVKEAVQRAWGHELDGGEEEEGGAAGLTAADVTDASPSPPPAPKTAEEREEEARWDAEAADLTKTLGAHMGWFVEFPHVDGRFIQVFYTLPGFTPGLRTAEFAEEDRGE